MRTGAMRVAKTAAKSAAVTGFAWWYADMRGWVRRDRTAIHRVRDDKGTMDVSMQLDVKATPPPIGMMDWPAGRVLLQWAVDGGIPLTGAVVVEIGSGVGTTAIGLALAAQAAGKDSGNASRVVATDICLESLENLRSNALKNGLRVGSAEEILHEAQQQSGTTPSLGISRWDASLGTLNALPLPARNITHLIGADVVYHGGATDVEDPSNRMHSSRSGLANTIRALLDENPNVTVSLLLIDRFSGPTVAALSQVTGVSVDTSYGIDPALATFESQCKALGLSVLSRRVHGGTDIARSVGQGQTAFQRFAWSWVGYWDGMVLYTVTRDKVG